jgi:hypothetical protein
VQEDALDDDAAGEDLMALASASADDATYDVEDADDSAAEEEESDGPDEEAEVASTPATSATMEEGEFSAKARRWLQKARACACGDRDILERGTKAFMSHLRAYKVKRSVPPRRGSRP